jgi:hypothetical protein
LSANADLGNLGKPAFADTVHLGKSAFADTVHGTAEGRPKSFG